MLFFLWRNVREAILLEKRHTVKKNTDKRPHEDVVERKAEPEYFGIIFNLQRIMQCHHVRSFPVLNKVNHGILYTLALAIQVRIKLTKKVIVVACAAPIAPFALIKK